MPFVTEEVYHQLKQRADDITVKLFAGIQQPDKNILQSGALLKEVITAIRDARVKAQLKPKDPLTLHILSANKQAYQPIEGILAKQVNAGAIVYAASHIPNSIAIVVQKDKFFLETQNP